MAAKREYHCCVRRLIPASVVGFAATLIFCLSPAQAQVHGTSSSTTSVGHGSSGAVPSANVQHSRGFVDSNRFIFPLRPLPPQRPFIHHRSASPFPAIGEVYPYYVPAYALDPDDNSTQDSDYPSGPTIFDRRGSGQSSQAVEAAYAERESDSQRASLPQPPADSTADATPAPNQPLTVLIFKDGHQLEVQNYAIVGSTFFDLSPGHRLRIALADLDLASTAKQNDDRGVDFQLPLRFVTN